MKQFLFAAMAALVGAWLVPAAALADQTGPVDNPAFAAWSRCAVGSSVSYQQTDGGGQITSIKKTLTEKANDHVTLEDRVQGKMAPDLPMEIKSETVPAKLDKLSDQKPLPNETIQVGDGKIDCKVVEIVGKSSDGHQTIEKIWTSGRVPGGLVKTQESTQTETGKNTITLELKSYQTN